MPGFSIVTNVASLIAQEKLGFTNDLQLRTITRLTSGLRINSSADDAAGLAIANRFRSDISVLQQGVRNAADGLSTLQTIDGGLNNISLLIDRARTLATQSASGTFTGDRAVLNTEFTSVLTEIDRQAQAIGLDPSGSFNALLSVFIGGGRANNNITETTNGSVQIDLSNSSVNANRLGLKGVQALGGTEGTTDIGSSSTTSVQSIAADTTNTGSVRTSGFTEFHFVGPGFADTDQAQLSVNLTGVVDTTTLASAINSAISGFSVSSSAGQAFKDAGVKAVVNTDTTGKQQLAFTSSSTAFQVQAGDRLANALLGNFASGATGESLNVTRTGAATGGVATAGTIKVRIDGGGLTTAQTLTVTAAGGENQTALTALLNTQLAANTTLVSAGYSVASDGTNLTFTNDEGERFDVIVAGDVGDTFGFGTGELGGGVHGTATDVTYSTITGSAAFDNTVAGTATLSIYVEGSEGASSETLAVVVATTTTDVELVDQINSLIQANSLLSTTDIQATQTGGTITIASAAGTLFRISVDDLATPALKFGDNDTGSITAGTFAEAVDSTNFINSGGAQATASTAFARLNFGDDVQSLAFSAKDSAGVIQNLVVNLSFANSFTLDQAVDRINSELQASNNSTLKQIVAVKERVAGGTTENIRFLSTLSSGFSVSIGDLVNDHGVANTDSSALLKASTQLAGGSVADISSKENAETAVTLLATAVSKLAAVQADVGKGQNQLQFAIGLATTQITNLSAAESRIRDADLAAEAANLTRAAILQQAGVAALAQANSAPQAVLALLRG